jgi:hypothetical protein
MNNIHRWDWKEISRIISMEDVIRYPNRTWNRMYLSCNKNITIDVIRSNLPNAVGEWNWNTISGHISMEEVIKYPNERWNKMYLSNNVNMNKYVLVMNLPNAIGKWEWTPDTDKKTIVTDRILKKIDTSPNNNWLFKQLINEPVSICVIYTSSLYLTSTVYKNLSISNWKDMIKCGCNRTHLSRCKDISIWWIDHIDGDSHSISDWKNDIDIICIY